MLCRTLRNALQTGKCPLYGVRPPEDGCIATVCCRSFKEAKEGFAKDRGLFEEMRLGNGRVLIETRREGPWNEKKPFAVAYRMTGGNSFYDGMITCSTLSGKAVCRWWGNEQGGKRRLSGKGNVRYSGAFLRQAAGSAGGNRDSDHAVYQTMPEADITCLDYSPDMMRQAREKADRLHLKNVTFRQGDVGALS